GKVCLVCGGTSGIGRAIALGYAQAGARVIAGSSNPEKVSSIKKELGESGDAIQLDVSKPESVAAAMRYCAKKYGKVDVVVNAAGVIKRQPTLEMPLEEFDRIVRVNLIGSFIVGQAAAKVMKDQAADSRGVRGCLLYVASASSFAALEGVCAYGCSKAGIVALVKSLANDWAQYGIRVNALAPGFIPTPLNRGLIEGTPRGEWIKKHTPWGRFGDAEDLVGTAVYLVSPAASFTTGETVIVDGGFLARGI
ncbi:MAG TPA: SDR family oxidoreductase, partial [Tepidisphaeraceae bacterium]|nr:SDR family oxidoreductase [Tepidisphaeraceae bacterium]